MSVFEGLCLLKIMLLSGVATNFSKYFINTELVVLKVKKSEENGAFLDVINCDKSEILFDTK